MKKLLLFISIAFISCSKDEICLHCEKEGLPVIDVCESDVPEISVVAYERTNEGYVCERYDN